MNKIDLHIHSNCSDGSDSPKDLLHHIIRENIHIFALTDHDTVEGCAEIISSIPPNIKFIPGVELTCIADDIKCHILGLNCDYNNKQLLELIAKGKILRRKKLDTRIKYLKDTWNIELTPKELDWLYSRKSVVKTHIANILVQRKLAQDNISAMKKYLDGCKSGDTRFQIQEAISAIKNSGGIPIWAHPLGGEGEKHEDFSIFIKKLEKMVHFGIEGLECYYSRYSTEEIETLTNIAQKYNLLISGGSDYHGNNKNGINLAQLNNRNKYSENINLTVLSKLIRQD